MSHPDLAAFDAKWEAVINAFKPRAQPKEVKPKEDGKVPLIDWDIDGTEELEQELKSLSTPAKIRFLNARPGKVDVAVELAQKVCKWRAAVKPQSVTPDLLPHAIEQKVWRIGGWLKCGYPIAFVNAATWSPSSYYAVDEYIRYVGYMCEVLAARMGKGVTRWAICFDLGQFNPEMVRPVAMRCISNLASITQEVHCERLAAAFLCFYNKVFYYSWKLIKPLADQRTVRKFHWMQPKGATTIEEGQDLSKWIDKSSLEKRFGGDMEDGSWPAFTGNFEADVGTETPPPFDPTAPEPLEGASEDPKPLRPAFLDNEKLDGDFADAEAEDKVNKAAAEDEFADANED